MPKFSGLPASVIAHTRLLTDSFSRVTGGCLIADPGDDEQLALNLFDAPFALLSHGTERDPVFNYANATALTLFKYDWRELITLPSRLSAQPVIREERARLLDEVTQRGFITDYSGVRIAKDGSRFMIEAAVVWNVVDSNGVYRGQAATFSRWEKL